MAKLRGHKMSAGFDPYLTWLSIHPEQQPPDHYRLLGLNRFESKPDVIENAMDGRLQFLAAFANGEHGEVAQRLIHEIEAAGVCLLNRDAKVGYDKQLRAISKKLKRAKPLVKAKPLPDSESPLPDVADKNASPNASIHVAALDGQDQPTRVLDFVDHSVPAGVAYPTVHLRGGQRRGPSQTTVAVIVATTAVAVIFALIFIVESSSRSASARLEENKSAEVRGSTLSPSKPSQPSRLDDGRPPGEATGQSPPEAADEKSSDSMSGEAELGASDAGNIQVSLPARQATPAIDARVQEAVEAVTAQASKTARRPVPEAGQRNAAAAFVREIFEVDMEEAAGDRTTTGALLEEMLSHADQSSIEDTELFAVLSESRRLAIQVGLADRAVTIADRIARSFEGSAWDIRMSTLKELGKSARSSEAKADLARTCIPLLDEAIATEVYEILPPLLDIARSAAARATSDEEIALRKEVHARQQSIEAMLRAWDDLTQVRKTLEQRPDDATSNLRMGRFYCLVRNDWTAGLSYLALGGDHPLAKAATAELVAPADASEQLQLANLWYDAAEVATASERSSIEDHALDWYRTCIDGLEGLKQKHAETRIAKLAPDENATAQKKVKRDEKGPDINPPKIILGMKLSRTAYAQLVDNDYGTIANYGNFPHFRFSLRPRPMAVDRTALYIRALFQGSSTTSGVVRVKIAQAFDDYPRNATNVGTWDASTVNQHWIKVNLSPFGKARVEAIEVDCLVTQGTGRIEPRVAIWAIDPDL